MKLKVLLFVMVTICVHSLYGQKGRYAARSDGNQDTLMKYLRNGESENKVNKFFNTPTLLWATHLGENYMAYSPAVNLYNPDGSMNYWFLFLEASTWTTDSADWEVVVDENGTVIDSEVWTTYWTPDGKFVAYPRRRYRGETYARDQYGRIRMSYFCFNPLQHRGLKNRPPVQNGGGNGGYQLAGTQTTNTPNGTVNITLFVQGGNVTNSGNSLGGGGGTAARETTVVKETVVQKPQTPNLPAGVRFIPLDQMPANTMPAATHTGVANANYGQGQQYYPSTNNGADLNTKYLKGIYQGTTANAVINGLDLASDWARWGMAMFGIGPRLSNNYHYNGNSYYGGTNPNPNNPGLGGPSDWPNGPNTNGLYPNTNPNSGGPSNWPNSW